MAAAQDVLGPPPVMDSFFDDHIADYGPHPPESFFEHMMAEESTPGPPGGSSNWLVSPSYLNIQRESVYRDIHIRSCVYRSLSLYIYIYIYIIYLYLVKKVFTRTLGHCHELLRINLGSMSVRPIPLKNTALPLPQHLLPHTKAWLDMFRLFLPSGSYLKMFS